MMYVVKMKYQEGTFYLRDSSDVDCYAAKSKEAELFDLFEAVYQCERLSRDTLLDSEMPVYYIAPVVSK